MFLPAAQRGNKHRRPLTVDSDVLLGGDQAGNFINVHLVTSFWALENVFVKVACFHFSDIL